MLPYGDQRVCTRCGRCGVTQATCPKCKTCSYCRQSGHLIANCPRCPACYLCGLKGHRAIHCRTAPRVAPKPEVRSIPRIQASSCAKPLSPRGNRALNLIITPGSHDDQAWTDLPQDIRDSVPRQSPVGVPTLEKECVNMLQDILDNRLSCKLPDFYHCQYLEAIQAHGGVSHVAQNLLGSVSPEIRRLEGRPINAKCLEDVRLQQNTPWSSMGGYLDAITDDRDKNYLRLYVGQSKGLPNRIFDTHRLQMLMFSTKSLHYFIVWLGNGHRQARFVQLWAVPEGTAWDSWQQIRFNLLESLFCRAFSTHHGSVLPPEDVAAAHCLGYGLNIISPLMQGMFMTQMQKSQQCTAMMRSPDHQIRQFLSFRYQETTRKYIPRYRPWARRDYDAALSDALGSELFESLQLPMHVSNTNLTLGSKKAANHPICGSLSALIGILLGDEGSRGPDDDQNKQEQSQRITLPWVLEQSGFNNQNILAWRHNTATTSSLTSVAAMDLTSHHSILEASSAKVVLMSGSRSVEIMRGVWKDAKPYTLKLRGYSYRIYIARSGKDGFQRLFLSCPQLPMKSWTIDGIYAAKICEILKFAAVATNLQEYITPYFLESSTAISAIVRQRALEKKGFPKMTTDTLTPGLKVWLARKGFLEDSDIRKLEELAGSLIRGLLVLLYVLPRRPSD
ncbi:hypothetical protein VTK73DRAFT_7567 [Phialemonium thermophilum]|uniref:CCHC-type domain-containing protein n=1 Tax=Phialemonium thermophilum TaxID=223376 RepID=A0ABR3WDY6_9PEZI